MPNYDYECPACDTTVERNVEMEQREKQWCSVCSEPLTRKFTFKGAVWSPTKNGGMS